MDPAKTTATVEAAWEKDVLSTLEKYVSIPNASPEYDPAWATNGHQEAAVELLTGWVESQGVQGLKLEVIKSEGRTPLILMEVAPFDGQKPCGPHSAAAAAAEGGAGGKAEKAVDACVMMYGHLDKQPPLDGAWSEGLSAYKPVIREGKLYGRGSADDGYATFAAVVALKAIQEQGRPHGRCAIVIEAAEESGSPDLPHYMELISPRLGDVRLIVCLDSGAGDYDHFWLTNSLRGLAMGTLKVTVLQQGMHSGAASGVVPSSFRIARNVMDRIEDSATGEVKVPALFTEISETTRAEAKAVAGVLGDTVWKEFPLVTDSMVPASPDNTELLLNKTWRPALSTVGAAGLPALLDAGNVLRSDTSLKLSMRLPPRVDPDKAVAAMKAELERDPPYGAKVEFLDAAGAPGWAAPALHPAFEKKVQAAAEAFYDGKPMLSMGEGGSIPFMGMLGAQFPKAQFIVTGVLGPGSNAHGPDEFLHIKMAQRVTSCVAHIVESFDPAE